jgi:hypothetical protein
MSRYIKRSRSEPMSEEFLAARSYSRAARVRLAVDLVFLTDESSAPSSIGEPARRHAERSMEN